MIAGTLENIDVQRFRKGQSRKIINEALHPKWEKDIGKVAHIYYDVGLLILDEVCMYNFLICEIALENVFVAFCIQPTNFCHLSALQNSVFRERCWNICDFTRLGKR